MAFMARSLAVLVMLALSAVAATAQNTVPAARPLEALVKSSLMSFNDANLTGDYRVFHARLSEPFRKQFSPGRLKETFREFNEKNVDIDIVTAMAPVYDPEPLINGEGRLILKGYFPTEPTRVAFAMDFVKADGDWKLIRLNVTLSSSTETDKKRP